MPRVATQHVADQATRLQKAFLERFRLFQYVFHPCPTLPRGFFRRPGRACLLAETTGQ
jgi:hypothetical protein